MYPTLFHALFSRQKKSFLFCLQYIIDGPVPSPEPVPSLPIEGDVKVGGGGHAHLRAVCHIPSTGRTGHQ